MRRPGAVCIATTDRRLLQFLSKMLFVDMPDLAGTLGELIAQSVTCLAAC